MDSHGRVDGLLELAWLACEGIATDEQLAALARRLHDDPKALQQYVQYVGMYADLQWDGVERESVRPEIVAAGHLAAKSTGRHAVGGAPSAPPVTELEAGSLNAAEYFGSTTQQEGLSSKGSHWPGIGWPSFVLATLFAAILGALGSDALRWSRSPGQTIAEQEPQRPVLMPVAYLTSMNGCAWGNGSPQLPSVGDGLGLGEELTLLEGIAEFRLSSGVYLSIEGPAGLVLTSPSSLALQYGKLTAHVPWSVADFKVSAGTARFEASDAEFGICVTGGRVDAHVFSGEAMAINSSLFDDRSQLAGELAQGTADANGVFSNATLAQGSAITLVSRNGVLTSSKLFEADPGMFATKLSMAGRLPVSERYVDAVLSSDPLAYWRFESDDNGVVVSETDQRQKLEIVGALRLAGSSENRVAEFRPDAECYLVHRNPLAFEGGAEYSIEVWVKPSHTHCSGIVSLCAVDAETSQELCAFLLELESTSKQPVRSVYSATYPNAIRFLHRSPPGRSSKIGTSCFSQTPYDVRRWQHVVAVKRGAEMQLYLDGKLSATAQDESPLAETLLLIAGRPETTGSSLQFIGQIDEIAVYPRALPSEEVEKHYKAVDWTSETAPVKSSRHVGTSEKT